MLTGHWTAVDRLSWELTGSNTPYDQMRASVELLGNTEEEQNRVRDEVFWNKKVLDFNVHAPIGGPEDPYAGDWSGRQWKAWGFVEFSEPEAHKEGAVYFFVTKIGDGFKWFSALASTKRDVELYYEVLVPSPPEVRDFYYELHTWDCRPGHGPRRLTVVNPPAYLWTDWDIPADTEIRPVT
jgi:hypothetical protein